MAQVGSRLSDAAAAKMTDDFFTAFEAKLRPVQAVPAAAGEVPAPSPAWHSAWLLRVGVAIVAVTMIVVDAPAATAAQRTPVWFSEIFDHITDFGKSVWFLVPIALALAAIALLASPTLPRMSRRVRSSG